VSQPFPGRQPGEALQQALRAVGCEVTREEAARLAAVLVDFASDGVLVSPAASPRSDRALRDEPKAARIARRTRGALGSGLPDANNVGQSICIEGGS